MVKIIIAVIILFCAILIIRELQVYKRIIKEEDLSLKEGIRKKALKVKSKRTGLKISNDKLEGKIKKKE